MTVGITGVRGTVVGGGVVAPVGVWVGVGEVVADVGGRLVVVVVFPEEAQANKEIKMNIEETSAAGSIYRFIRIPPRNVYICRDTTIEAGGANNLTQSLIISL